MPGRPGRVSARAVGVSRDRAAIELPQQIREVSGDDVDERRRGADRFAIGERAIAGTAVLYQFDEAGRTVDLEPSVIERIGATS